MISHGVEISIAGGGGEMVRGPSPRRFYFYFFIFLYHVLCFIILVRVQRLRAALAMVKKNPL